MPAVCSALSTPRISLVEVKLAVRTALLVACSTACTGYGGARCGIGVLGGWVYRVGSTPRPPGTQPLPATLVLPGPNQLREPGSASTSGTPGSLQEPSAHHWLLALNMPSRTNKGEIQPLIS